MSDIDFAAFQSGPGGGMCRTLGVDISSCRTWAAFTESMIRFNDSGPEFPLVTKAERLYGKLSTGERALLEAVLQAADFARQADELARGNTWHRISSTSGPHALAIAACIARID